MHGVHGACTGFLPFWSGFSRRCARVHGGRVGMRESPKRTGARVEGEVTCLPREAGLEARRIPASGNHRTAGRPWWCSPSRPFCGWPGGEGSEEEDRPTPRGGGE